jgi:hypothetical protein
MIPEEMEEVIQLNNPWWRAERVHGVPPMRRWAFHPVVDALKQGMTPAVILTGPRQVGKTTLLVQVIHALLDEGIAPKRIFRLQFDELPELLALRLPVLEIVQWYAQNVVGKTLNQAAHDGEQAYIFLDEVQNLANWAPQLKHLVDIQPVRVLVTGSSALRIEAGKDSLAGRVTTYEMGPLLLREIADLRGFGAVPSFLPSNGPAPLKQKEFWLSLRAFGQQHREIRHQAFAAFSERGAYPVAHVRADQPWEKLADLLNETIIKRVISHDLRMGARGKKRDAHLLEEVFRLACRYIGQAPSQAMYLEEMRQSMHANIGFQRIYNYLKFLDGTLLLRLIEPLELRLKRRRGARKLCLCDHALRASWLQEVVPLAPEALERLPHLSDLAGHIAESTVGYFCRSLPNLGVASFPEHGSEPEVDFILTIGEHRIPVEVKHRRRIDFSDTLGVRAFIEKRHYNAPFGVLVTQLDEPAADDPRIVSIPLSSILLMR